VSKRLNTSSITAPKPYRFTFIRTLLQNRILPEFSLLECNRYTAEVQIFISWPTFVTYLLAQSLMWECTHAWPSALIVAIGYIFAMCLKNQQHWPTRDPFAIVGVLVVRGSLSVVYNNICNCAKSYISVKNQRFRFLIIRLTYCMNHFYYTHFTVAWYSQLLQSCLISLHNRNIKM